MVKYVLTHNRLVFKSWFWPVFTALVTGVTSALIKAGVCAVVRDQTTEGNDRTPGYRNRRLKILGQDEIDEIYGLPRFSDEERELHFALTPSEEAGYNCTFG